jgi:hypothetical protein
MKNKLKNKNLKNLILNDIDGETSLEDKHRLEKECLKNPQLAKEKEIYEKLISTLKEPDRLDTPPGFTEKVMARIKNKPLQIRAKIYRWIQTPLEFHLNWIWKWSLVFTTILLVLAGAKWEHFRVQELHKEIDQLERYISDLKQKPIPTHFVFYSASAKSVHIVGSFNDWQIKEQFRMVNLTDDGIWSITVMLKPGQYEYMYLVDGKNWVTDPSAIDYRSDGFGNKNSIVDVLSEI